MPLNTSDIFLFIIFIAVIAIYDFLHRGILTTETLHTIIPENGTIYIILIIAFIYMLYLSLGPVSVLDWVNSVLDRDRSQTEMSQFWTELSQFWTKTCLSSGPRRVSVLNRVISVLDRVISVLDRVVSVPDYYIKCLLWRLTILSRFAVVICK